MSVDQTSLDRIRNATFPSSRRGYDKNEVEKFLARLADWLETGAGEESRSDTVNRRDPGSGRGECTADSG